MIISNFKQKNLVSMDYAGRVITLELLDIEM